MMNDKNIILTSLVIIIAVVLIACIVGFFNAVVKLNQLVKEAFSTMDIYLKKRWDLIPNLVEVVKSYAKHETDLIAEVTKLRSKNYDTKQPDEKIKTNQKITPRLIEILAIAEKYPELKADVNFRKLSDQLVQIEDEIANSRKYYNGTVRLYNTKISTFPNSILAKIFRYRSYPMFETADSDKDNIKVSI